MRLVVIDTNVWVSAFLNRTGFPARIKDAWVNGQFEIVISTPHYHPDIQNCAGLRLKLNRYQRVTSYCPHSLFV